MNSNIPPIYEFRPLRAENFSPFRFDAATNTLTREHEEVRLRPTAKRVLLVFLKRPGKVLTRDQVLDEAWGSDKFIDVNNVDQAISYLKEKLGETAENKYFETVPGKRDDKEKGFRFVAHVVSLPEPGAPSVPDGTLTTNPENPPQRSVPESTGLPFAPPSPCVSAPRNGTVSTPLVPPQLTMESSPVKIASTEGAHEQPAQASHPGREVGAWWAHRVDEVGDVRATRLHASVSPSQAQTSSGNKAQAGDDGHGIYADVIDREGRAHKWPEIISDVIYAAGKTFIKHLPLLAPGILFGIAAPGSTAAQLLTARPLRSKLP